jgi:hypothetical protein
MLPSECEELLIYKLILKLKTTLCFFPVTALSVFAATLQIKMGPFVLTLWCTEKNYFICLWPYIMKNMGTAT